MIAAQSLRLIAVSPAAHRVFGYICPINGGISVEEQLDILIKAGVPERSIFTDIQTPIRDEQRRMFGEVSRSLRRGDVLITSSLASFGRGRDGVIFSLAALESLGVGFVSVDDRIDTRKYDPDLLFKLGLALMRAELPWRRRRMSPATRAARYSGMSGRRPRLSPLQEERARALWLDPESTKTNERLAREVGLSASRLYGLFGARPARGRPPPTPRPPKPPALKLGPPPTLDGKRLLAVKRAVVDTDLTMSEIAAMFDISLSTLGKYIPGGRAELRARVKRGREKLR